MFVNSSFILSMFSKLAKSRPQTTTPAHGCCTQWLPAAGTGDGWNWGWLKLGTDGTGDVEVGKDADHCDPSQLSRTGSWSTSTACVCQWCQRRDPWNQRHSSGSECPSRTGLGAWPQAARSPAHLQEPPTSSPPLTWVWAAPGDGMGTKGSGSRVGWGRGQPREGRTEEQWKQVHLYILNITLLIAFGPILNADCICSNDKVHFKVQFKNSIQKRMSKANSKWLFYIYLYIYI